MKGDVLQKGWDRGPAGARARAYGAALRAATPAGTPGAIYAPALDGRRAQVAATRGRPGVTSSGNCLTMMHQVARCLAQAYRFEGFGRLLAAQARALQKPVIALWLIGVAHDARWLLDGVARVGLAG